MTAVVTAAAALLGGFDIVALIIFLVTRHDNKKNISGRLDKVEKDGVRTQMLLLILLQPEKVQEILSVAQYYFSELHGDWYMTGFFNNWLVENNVAEPEWFEH